MVDVCRVRRVGGERVHIKGVGSSVVQELRVTPRRPGNVGRRAVAGAHAANEFQDGGFVDPVEYMRTSALALECMCVCVRARRRVRREEGGGVPYMRMTILQLNPAPVCASLSGTITLVLKSLACSPELTYGLPPEALLVPSNKPRMDTDVMPVKQRHIMHIVVLSER